MKSFVAALALSLLACADPQSFEERRHELEAQTPTDCGTLVTSCDSKERALAVIGCIQQHLAARTGARAVQPHFGRASSVYAIDGELIALDGTFSYEENQWHYTERHCRGIARHEAGTSCVTFGAIDCDD